MFCQYFMNPEFEWTEELFEVPREAEYGMEGLLPHVERISELAGGSLANVAIGTDMDGGFGAELTPTGVDTIADLQGFAEVLGRRRDRGRGGRRHPSTGNALRFFREAWS